MVLLGRVLLALTILLERAWLLLIGLLERTSLTLTCSVIGLLERKLIAQMSLLAWTLLPKIGLLVQIELAPTVFLNEYYYQ